MMMSGASSIAAVYREFPMLIESQTMFRGRVVTLNVETVQLPNGRRVPLEIVHHPGGAAVVAVDAERRVCLLHQFRHAAGGWVWELPAGKLEPHEPPAATARRELAEEGGVSAGRWTELGAYISSPGVFTERIHLFLAQELSTATQALEKDEVFDVHWVAFDVAIDRVHRAEICDSKTALGLLRAQHKLGF
jgi:ADP-ribose pyrophosphatase